VSQKSFDLEELPESAMPAEPEHTHPHTHQLRQQHDKLLTQVAEWLQAEKAKRASKKAKLHKGISTPTIPDDTTDHAVNRPRSSSQSSNSSEISLEKLQRILENSMTSSFGQEKLGSASPNLKAISRRKSSIKGLTRTLSSDTEYQDGDVVVPSCEVVLDNSKTLSYSGGTVASSTADLGGLSRKAEKERKAWSEFKSEILRIAHTLRLKGWRRVPLENGDDIEVERLSGALTNAVYVVSPPKHLPPPASHSGGPVPKKPPPKLLLRIYGPQVEHLIDRENELGILRRLARKKIGPRLLGTFQNGRFEEYFASTTLTSADLRVPDTSKQIAKRMRELHDGIDLLAKEREDGAFVWRNWDKWVDRCELVIKYLDDQILNGKTGRAVSKSEAWKERGLVCGVEWKLFKGAIDKYRSFLVQHYGGEAGVKEKLVFAHNDVSPPSATRIMI
jgi:choline kinase